MESYLYTGEVNQNNEYHGYGVRDGCGPETHQGPVEGIWFNGEEAGLCKNVMILNSLFIRQNCY